MNLTWRQVVRWRIARHLLLDPALDAVTVAGHLGGIHSQVASCAELIAGIRSAAPVDLEAALWRHRSLVRIWAMRGTLHLISAADLDVWIAALTDRESRRRFPPSWERAHGVTAADQHRITGAVGAVLGATPRSRIQLVDAICAQLGDDNLRGPLSAGWGALLKPAAAHGLLCSAPPTDGTATFVAPAAWLARPLAHVDPDEANRRVLLRFLATAGPATAVDIGRWWGEPPAAAREWLRAHADALTPVTVDGERGYVVRAEDADAIAATPDGGKHPADGPVLLPGFDPWVISPASHRARAIPAGRAGYISRKSGWISPVLVMDNTIAGVWEHAVTRGRLTVTVRPFHTLHADLRGAAQRYGALLGAQAVDLVIVPAD